MARYINEDEFVAWVKEHWCADCQNNNGLRCRACWIDDAIDIVEEAPAADVAPKSEVARLERICHSYALQYGTVKDQQKVIDKAKSEVITEFAERLKTYYRNLDKTAGALVEYHIDQVAKEMLEKGGEDDD